MKRAVFALALCAGLAFALAGCSEDPAAPNLAEKSAGDLAAKGRHGHGHHRGGVVVTADRGSGTITVLDARDAAVVGAYALPQAEGEPRPEPMYVNQMGRRVFVGDRANDRVVVFRARDFEVEAVIPAGRGVFHQWVDRHGSQLWVNNDIDNTITVIDARSLGVLATVDVPADLTAMGGKPHDVVVHPRGGYAYVTVLGVAGDNDYLVQYETQGFTEVNRAAVGKDPHVSVGRNTRLYVPCQNSDQVLVFHPRSLALVDELTIPGAHGAAMALDGRRFYTTNLPGGGAGGIYTVDTRHDRILGGPVDTPHPVPHNIALSDDGRSLFVTHSGPEADKVTFYRLTGRDRTPQYRGEATVGLNPFGIAFVR